MRPGAQHPVITRNVKNDTNDGGARARATRFIRLSRAAIKLENSIYFAHAGPNVGRTRDEINLRSFLGIKSGGSTKFGLQPSRRLRPLLKLNTPTREHGIMRIFNLCFVVVIFHSVLMERLVLSRFPAFNAVWT